MSRGLIVVALLAAAGCATAARPQMDVITATNIFFQPDEAVRLTLDGIAADPAHAPEIAAAAVTSAPDQAAAIESAAVAAVPHRAAEISLAVAAARAQPHPMVSALPREVAEPPRREVISEPSDLARVWINGWGPGNSSRPRWRNDSSGAVGIIR